VPEPVDEPLAEWLIDAVIVLPVMKVNVLPESCVLVAELVLVEVDGVEVEGVEVEVEGVEVDVEGVEVDGVDVPELDVSAACSR
jgi:formylmethanofuran dehydrogenase subunit B